MSKYQSDLRHIIWRIGNNEEVPMEFTAEGDVRVYLIDPFVRPSTQPLRNWRLSRRYRLPPRQTSYWCTIHKGLSFNRKQHIVGVRFLKNIFISFFNSQIRMLISNFQSAVPSLFANGGSSKAYSSSSLVSLYYSPAN